MREAITAIREIRKRDLQIHCPVCGKFQYRIREGYTSFVCEKCKTATVVIVKDGRMTLYEEEAGLPDYELGNGCGKEKMKRCATCM